MSYLKTAEGSSRRPAPDVLANTEEFPPLGGGKAGGPSTPTSVLGIQPPVQQQQQQQQHPNQSSQSQPAAGGDQKSDMNEELGKYGLGGILQIIRMTDPDLNTLALGYDLTTLGLSLNSPEPLYTTLCCPWSDAQSVVQPEYRIPACYSLQPPHLRFQMFQRFDVETLFYIFYSMPRDVLQLAAAQELYNRDWRFHKEHKLWFIRAPEGQLAVKTSTYERGNYVVFDPERWRKDRRDDFVLVYDQLEDKTAMQEAKQQHQHHQQLQQQQQQAAQQQGPAMGNQQQQQQQQQWRGN